MMGIGHADDCPFADYVRTRSDSSWRKLVAILTKHYGKFRSEDLKRDLDEALKMAEEDTQNTYDVYLHLSSRKWEVRFARR